MFKPRRKKKTIVRKADRKRHSVARAALSDQRMFEALEQRTLLSVVPDGGLLSITGSAGDDALTVSVSMDGTVTVAGDLDGGDGSYEGVEEIEIDTGDGNDQVTLEGDPIYGDKIAIGEDDGSVEVNWKNLSKIDVFLDNVETLTVNTLGGNDGVVVKDVSGTTLVSSDTLEIDGGAGRDKLIAKKSGIDVDLFGGDDNDVLIGGDGDDSLSGGEGRDKLIGGDGDDDMSGDGGDDKINGGKGNDVIDGGDGRDKLIGSDGEDDIFGGAGEDKINAGKGHDTVDGGDDDDVINGSAGDDTLGGGGGNDKINGAGGDDDVDGGDGDDRINGGGGNDLIDGGAGADDVHGAGGADIIVGDDEDDVRDSDTDDGVVAVLLGDFIVPDPVDTDARGVAFFDAKGEDSDSPAIDIEIFLHGIDLDGEQTPDNPDDDATGIHLHMAPFGVNGPHVFDIITGFDEAGNPISDDLDDLKIDPEHGRIRSKWDGDESHDDGDRVVDVLMSEATEFYLVIHTEGNPSGELRGQLADTEDDEPDDDSGDDFADDLSFADLLGENIFPTPVVTDAEGFASFEVEGEGTASPAIEIEIELDGLDLDGEQTPDDDSDDVTGIHIHRGPEGVNGPHVFDVITGFDGAGDPISDDLDDLMIFPAEGKVLSVWDNDESHDGGDTVTDILTSEEDEFYLVVHTVGNPTGELRGQIDDIAYSDIVGDNIVPDPVETDAEGFALFFVEGEDTAFPSIEIDIDLDDLDLDGEQTPGDDSDDVTGIHLHRGSAGENGPHVFDIISGFDGAGDPISDDLDDLLIFADEGLVLSIWDNDESHDDGDRVADILAAEDDFYIVVHTVGHPGGEIRGQIITTDD